MSFHLCKQGHFKLRRDEHKPHHRISIRLFSKAGEVNCRDLGKPHCSASGPCLSAACDLLYRLVVKSAKVKYWEFWIWYWIFILALLCLL